MKPNPAKFDPAKSIWVDVTAKAPWGAGAKMPMIPFRTLALTPHFNKPHDGICIAGDVGGMGEKHFDLCVGREDHHIAIPSVGSPGTIRELEILDASSVSKPGAK